MEENKELENKEIGQNGDLLTEPYDNNVKMMKDEDAFSIFAGQRQLSLTYSLTAEEVKKGLLRFQKKTIFKKNILYTVLLAIICVLYLGKIIYNPKDGLSYFLSILSLAVILFVWLTPLNHRNKMAKSAALVRDVFTMTVCEKGLIAGTGENASYIFFENEPVEVYSYPDMLLISVDKENIFVLPRRCASEEDWSEAKQLLQAGLGKRFTEQEA